MLPTIAFFAITFALLLLLGRLAHRALHAVSLLVAGGSSLATYLYAFPLLPGVALHECSHALMAMVLGVEVRSFSLIPQRKADGVTLGSVEVVRSDTLKNSLIGAAPLMFGLAALSAIGWFAFDTRKLTEAVLSANINAISAQVIAAFGAADAFIWFYLLFAIANTMVPSESDRQAWPPVLIGLAIIFGVVAVFFGTDILRVAGPVVLRTFNWLGAVFAITAFADLIIMLPLWLLVRILERATGKRVQFR